MQTKPEKLISLYRELGIDRQIDYGKFYLYSLTTHSTVIEGSIITELENQIIFDQGISPKGKNIMKQYMSFDLRNAYEHAARPASVHTDAIVDLLRSLSALVLKNTGRGYKTALGDFSSARGDLHLLNITAGPDGKLYMNYSRVPIKLPKSYTRLNRKCENHAAKSMIQLYEIGLDAHYDSMTVYSWTDGNGRMARLLINMLQFEFGLTSIKILKEDKEEYTKALMGTRENEDLNVFREFMTTTMIKNLTRDIEVYRKSIDDTPISEEKPRGSREKKVRSRKKIMTLLSQNDTLSVVALAGRIGIAAKTVEKQIAALRMDGVFRQIGLDKGGYW